MGTDLDQFRADLNQERQRTAAIRAEWSEWRGRMNAEMGANAQRIGDINVSVQTGLDRIDRNMNRRFDKQETEIAEIKAQTTKTNGSVTNLKLWRAELEGQQAGVTQVEAKVALRKRVIGDRGTQVFVALLAGGGLEVLLHHLKLL